MLYFLINRFLLGYRIDIRLFFIYTPIACTDNFQDCLGFISEFCEEKNYSKAIIFDPEGPNKRMEIKYPLNSKILTYLRNNPYKPKYQFYNSKLYTLFSFINTIKQSFKLNSLHL